MTSQCDKQYWGLSTTTCSDCHQWNWDTTACSAVTEPSIFGTRQPLARPKDLKAAAKLLRCSISSHLATFIHFFDLLPSSPSMLGMSSLIETRYRDVGNEPRMLEHLQPSSDHQQTSRGCLSCLSQHPGIWFSLAGLMHPFSHLHNVKSHDTICIYLCISIPRIHSLMDRQMVRYLDGLLARQVEPGRAVERWRRWIRRYIE